MAYVRFVTCLLWRQLSDALEQSVQDLDDRQQASQVKQEYEKKLQAAAQKAQVPSTLPNTAF